MPPKHDRPGNRGPLRMLTVLFAIGCTLLLGQGLLWGGTARGAARIPVPDGAHVGVPNNTSAVSGPWQAASPMPIAVGRYTAAQEGERLYVIGGFVAPGAAEGQTLRYDATTGQWTTLRPMLNPVADEGAAIFDGRIYVVGGYLNDGMTSILQIYDIASDTWSLGASLPVALGGAAVGAYDGKVYVAGGGTTSGQVLNSLHIYDIASDSWSRGPSLPVPTNFPGFVQVGQYLYIVGGYGTTPSRAGPGPGSAGSEANPFLPLKAADGHKPTAPFWNNSTTQRLDMSEGSWSVGPAWTQARADFGLASDGCKLYALGGDTNGDTFFDPTDEVDELTLAAWPGGSWEPSLPYLPSPRQGNDGGFFTTGLQGGEIWSTGGFDVIFNFYDEHLYRGTSNCFPPSPTPTSTTTPCSPSCTPTVTRTRTQTRTPTATPCNIAVTGSLDPSDPLETVRLFRDGIPSGCDSPKACPGLYEPIPMVYDAYTYTNSSGSAACITVSLDATGCGGNAIHSVAYLGSFDPNEVCANYLADIGDSPHPTGEYSFEVPTGASFVIVVNEVDQDAGCATYRLVVTGLPCTTPTPASTATRTGTATDTATRTHTPTLTWTPDGLPHTSTPTGTRTFTATDTATNTPSRTSTATYTFTTTFTATRTHTPTLTWTPDGLPHTSTPTGTRTFTPEATLTPGSTLTPTPTLTSTPCAMHFTDVSSTDYFYEPVRYLYCRGVISGYGDNTFRPYNNTTRGQLSKIVVLAEGWTAYTPPQPTFRDVPAGDAFYAYIETAYHQGIISGYDCGAGCLEFRPGNNVTRGQLCKIVVLAEGWGIYTPPTPTFRDVSTSNAFYSYVETAYRHNIVSGYDCGAGCLEFRPGGNATRGQICKIVYLSVTGP